MWPIIIVFVVGILVGQLLTAGMDYLGMYEVFGYWALLIAFLNGFIGMGATITLASFWGFI